MSRVTRRDVLVAASASFACSCASMPSAGGGSAAVHEVTTGRTCDHDLCRYWRRDAEVAAAQAEFDAAHGQEPGRVEHGGHELGRCGIGLPEAFK